MTTSRRSILYGLLAAGMPFGSAFSAPLLNARARIVEGSDTRGSTTALAGMLARRLAGRYASDVAAEWAGGARFRVAGDRVRRSAPDGTTILLTPMSLMTLFPHTTPRATRFHWMIDFTPVTTLGSIPFALVVDAAHPAADIDAFARHQRERGRITVGLPGGPGTPEDVVATGLAGHLGLNVSRSSNRHWGAVARDLGGPIDCAVAQIDDVVPDLRRGRVRALAFSGGQRFPEIPAPTFAELGLSQLSLAETFVLLLPIGAADRIVTGLYRHVEPLMSDGAFVEELRRRQVSPFCLSPAETMARLRAEETMWGQLVRDTGVPVQ